MQARLGAPSLDVNYHCPRCRTIATACSMFVNRRGHALWVFAAVPRPTRRGQDAMGPFSKRFKGLPDRDQQAVDRRSGPFQNRLFASRAKIEPSGHHGVRPTVPGFCKKAPAAKLKTPRTNCGWWTIQWPHSGRLKPTGSTTARHGADLAALCGLLQPPVAAVGAQEQYADAGDEEWCCYQHPNEQKRPPMIRDATPSRCAGGQNL